MSLPLTPEGIAAVYECLRAFPPFSKWKLPPSDEVEFQVALDNTVHGWYVYDTKTKRHSISISKNGVSQFGTLAMITAHEMIHLHQVLKKTASSKTHHNGDFRRIAGQVCKCFGWDKGVFV